MTTDKPINVGFAAYFEFRKGPQTWQLLITPSSPEGLDVQAPASMFRRRLTPSAPRKMWKQIASTGMTQGADITTKSSFIHPMFDSLRDNGWKLYMQTIVVETTRDDLQDVRQGKVPYKVIGRVLKCRKALKFSDKLFGEVTA